MKSARLPHIRFGLFLAAILAAGASFAWAQSSTTGALAGTALDASGAVVPGVAVTLTHTGTSQTQTTMTDESGLFGFSLLPPGSYDLVLAAQGFKTAEQKEVVVNVSETPLVSATLEPGATSDRVPCACQIDQAATSSTGMLVDSRTITEVPLTTRNFTQVLSMSAGSAANVNNAGVLGAGSQGATVSGNTAGGNYTIDGAASASTVPNPDTISEFRIQTSQYDAGYGSRVPTTNLVTRSGENTLHGSVWEFLRNDIFNANDYFLAAAGRPKGNLKQNQFGATIGGPIKRDKVFFFASYQGTRQVNGIDRSSTAVINLPPLTDDRSALALGSTFCPENYGPGANTFAGGVQVACDGSNINPVALKILQLKFPNGSYVIPTPQAITTGANGAVGSSTFSLPSTYGEDQVLVNLDYVISTKHSLGGRFYFGPNRMIRALGSQIDISASAPNVPGLPQITNGRDYIASIKLASVLTSNLVNEARMTYTQAGNRQVGPGAPLADDVGMIPADPFYPLLPQLNFSGPLGNFRVGNTKNKQGRDPRIFSWADNLSWIHGRHSIRTGVFFMIDEEKFFDTDPARGRLGFQNFTDFLLGLDASANGSPLGYSNVFSIEANEGAGAEGESIYDNRTNTAALFVQDDFKLTPRFTLNLGLRWEYIAPSFDRGGQRGNLSPALLSLMPIPPPSGTLIGVTVSANYNPNTINPYTGLPFGPPPAGVLVRNNNSLYENGAPLNTFAPRFGFAWQPGSSQERISVRGGYGWIYQVPQDRGNAPGNRTYDDQPFGQTFDNQGASNGGSTLQQPFPAVTLGFIPRSPTSSLADRVFGPAFRVPKLQRWNLTIQYRFSRTLSLDLGYAGSRGSSLLIAYGSNQPQLASPGNPVNCGLPNSAAGLGVSESKFAELGVDSSGCVTTNTSENAYLRVPIVGQAPTSLLAHQFVGRSSYNGMQATLRKQITHGLTFQANYTFSKSMAHSTIYNDQNNLDLSWGRTNSDRTHRLVANFSYQFPSPWTQGFAGKMLSGWSVSGITTIQSGSPMTLTDRDGGSVYGSAGTSTIALCPGFANKDLVTSGSTQARLDQWFNPSAICDVPEVGLDGSTGYGNTGVNIVNGPGQFNTDFSIGKATIVGGIREDAALAFRVEFYNALNRPNFSNPGTTFGTRNFGKITATSVASRLIQFGMKYVF